VVILAVGDVVGSSGMDMLARHLMPLKRLKNADMAVVNGENTAVVGMAPEHAKRLFDAGADVITLGNHTWGRRGAGAVARRDAVRAAARIIRAPAPGRVCAFSRRRGGSAWA
jgi:calcineurin-like phosphoesterase